MFNLKLNESGYFKPNRCSYFVLDLLVNVSSSVIFTEFIVCAYNKNTKACHITHLEILRNRYK